MIISIVPVLEYVDFSISILKLIVAGFMLMFLIGEKSMYVPRYWLMLAALFAWFIIADIGNMTLPINTFATSFSILTYVIITGYFCPIDKFLLGTKFYCVIVLLLNLLSQILYPTNGIYHDYSRSWQPYYFCGNANSFVFFYLFSVAVYVIDTYNRKQKLTLDVFVFEGILIYSMILGGSTTGITIMLLSLVASLFSFSVVRKWIKRHIRMILFVVLVVVVWLVWFGGWNNKLIVEFVENEMNEKASFIGRGFIWENAVKTIMQSPIFGHGSTSGSIILDSGGQLRSAHNNYLEIAILGGLPALILFVSIVIRCMGSVRKSRNSLCYYATAFVSFFCVAFLVEQNPFYLGFYALLGLTDALSKETTIDVALP